MLSCVIFIIRPAENYDTAGVMIRQTQTNLANTHPHPCSQVTGRFGLCSQSLRWDIRLSSRTTAVQPKTALSHVICSLDSILRMIRGTGRRWATVTTLRSTGHVCCWENHWVIQALQKACSQWGACVENRTKYANLDYIKFAAQVDVGS